MTNINKNNLLYRPCVGIALFNEQGQVFVGERIDTPGAWQMPQGGIDDGEDIVAAALRELQEEVGTGKADIIEIAEDKIRYDLPDHLISKLWNGKFRGQEQVWVAMKFTGEDSDINLNLDDHPEFSAWQWMDLSEIIDFIVPFKRDIYVKVVNAFSHLV